MRKAAVDVGSNSILVVVGEMRDSRLEPVFEASRVTGLGEGTKASGVLSESAMVRSLAALRELFELAREHGAEEIQAKATMAVRIAGNAYEFLARAWEQGTPVEVLSGEDEAELGFLAVADDPLLAPSRRITIIDPGGHSTELATSERAADGWRTLFRKSFPVGTLGLRDRPLHEEAPGSAALMEATREIDNSLAVEYLPGACGACVVLGATGTNLITLKKRMPVWDPSQVHGETLDFEEISQAVGSLCRLTDAQRAALPGLEKGREKTIHIGALILERFMFAVHTAEVMVSVRGWRHALLERMLRTPQDRL